LHLRRSALGFSMNTVIVATFNKRAPAIPLQERLAAAGIDAVLDDQSKLERYWFMSPPMAAVHIEVPAKRYLEARRLIEEWDRNDGILRSAVRCPECGGSRVEFPQITRKNLMPMLWRIFMALGVIRKEFFCVDCHYTWPLASPAAGPELDALGFPRGSKY
jgi:hypothetical protein